MASQQLDPKDFAIIEQVPIFVETVTGGKDGEPIHIDGEVLRQMANVNNERVVMGEPPVIHVGHNDDDKFSTKPVIGFMSDFITGVRNGLTTLYARFLVYPDQVDEIRKYPRRSIELNFGQKIISSIALLGSREPALDLGLLYQKDVQTMKFSKDTLSCEQDNILGDEKMDMSDEFKAKVLELLCETDMYKYFQAMSEKKDESADLEVKEDEKKVDEDKKDDEVKASDETMDEEVKKDEVVEEVKADEEKKEVKDEDKEAKKEDEEEDDNAKKFSAITAELEHYKLMFQRQEREKKLMVLESEGYCLDVASELADFDGLDEASFNRHLNTIRKFAKAAPVNKKFSVATISNGGSANVAKDVNVSRIEKIKAHALKNKITYQEAEKLI